LDVVVLLVGPEVTVGAEVMLLVEAEVAVEVMVLVGPEGVKAPVIFAVYIQ
jgi:hypothetical protein